MCAEVNVCRDRGELGPTAGAVLTASSCRAGGGRLIDMEANDFSRNHTARPGYQLQNAIDLPGWEDQSIWGWADGVGSFYAQLWRNGSTSDAPEIWLSGASTPYP